MPCFPNPNLFFRFIFCDQHHQARKTKIDIIVIKTNSPYAKNGVQIAWAIGERSTACLYAWHAQSMPFGALGLHKVSQVYRNGLRVFFSYNKHIYIPQCSCL